MNGTELLLALAVGVGLAAACGFRVFVPLFVMSLAARSGQLQLAANLDWLGSDPAMVALGIATVAEIAGYYVPWVDNLLDTIATPAAVVAGTLATASMLTGTDPLLQWGLGLIAGGGAAGVVQGATVTTRALSSLTTGGVGNPVVSTVETGASTLLAILAVAVPVLAATLVVMLLVWIGRLVFRRRRRRPVPLGPG